VAAMKKGMRLKRFCAKQLGDALEKRAYSFNRLVAFDFVKSLDHGFIPETWTAELSESTLKKESVSVRKRTQLTGIRAFTGRFVIYAVEASK